MLGLLLSLAIGGLLLEARPVRAIETAVVLVPIVTDPADAPRLLELAALLRTALADRGIPTVAARYTRTLKEAETSGDAFARALDLSGDFAVLRYDFYSDELVRAHTLRLIELAKAQTAILLAAPIANRIVLKRISRTDGQSIAVPDPYEPEHARRALAQLLPPSERTEAVQPTRVPVLPLRTRNWILGTAATGLAAATAATALAASRRPLGTRFQDTPPSDPNYLAMGDDWRARRAPMLAAASVASASLTTASVLFAANYDLQKLRWVSIPSAALGAAALAWAAPDLAHGRACRSDAASTCVTPQSQLDRGVLLALASAPLLAIATTHLSRRIHQQIRMHIDASPRSVSLAIAYRN